MGLAGSRSKQRISVDPNNKTWRDDKSRIGFKLLSSMGWEGEGTGLGTNGITAPIAVALKLNTHGIGCSTRQPGSTVASGGLDVKDWSATADAFEQVLQGLNETSTETTFLQADENVVTNTSVEELSSETPSIAPAVNRRLYRSKFVRNKRVSNYDQGALNEILGLSASSSTTTSTTSCASIEVEQSSTSIPSPDQQSSKTTTTTTEAIMKEIKVSISTTDYFERKRLEKLASVSVSCTTSPMSSEDSLKLVASSFHEESTEKTAGVLESRKRKEKVLDEDSRKKRKSESKKDKKQKKERKSNIESKSDKKERRKEKKRAKEGQ